MAVQFVYSDLAGRCLSVFGLCFTTKFNFTMYGLRKKVPHKE